MQLSCCFNIALESKKGKNTKDVKSAKKGDPGTESPRPEPTQTVNPLNDPDLPVKSENGQLYIPGNTTLVYLALACEYFRLNPSYHVPCLKLLQIIR